MSRRHRHFTFILDQELQSCRYRQEKMKRDFEYNLKLLEERDTELEHYDRMFAEYSTVLKCAACLRSRIFGMYSVSIYSSVGVYSVCAFRCRVMSLGIEYKLVCFISCVHRSSICSAHVRV